MSGNFHYFSVCVFVICNCGVQEILEQVHVVNLDSGDTVPLSLAEEKLPKCINPLSLHIMRRTKEYSRLVSISVYAI
jgi:hypothetical protein